MKIYEMEQGSEEWFAIKYGKIGGSSLAEIMTKINKPVNNTAKYLDILLLEILFIILLFIWLLFSRTSCVLDFKNP